MNPELQAKLVAYLDGLEKGAAKVGEFAEREIPETIREWLLWLAVERFVYAVAFLFAAVAVFVVVRRIVRAAPEMEKSYIAAEKRRYPDMYRDREPGDWFPIHHVAMAIGYPGAVLLLIGFGHWALQGAKVIIAPRVVIVEKVAELAKGK